MLKSEYLPVDTYDELLEQVKALIDPAFSDVANMSNIASLVYWSIEGVNWVGFYLFDGEQLMLGPFHGKPACVTLQMGKGVCGNALARRETIVVPDVDDYPGHIVCDTNSRSEVVVPIIRNGELFGVLDVDSPRLDRFGREEKEFFEATVRIFNATNSL